MLIAIYSNYKQPREWGRLAILRSLIWYLRVALVTLPVGSVRRTVLSSIVTGGLVAVGSVLVTTPAAATDGLSPGAPIPSWAVGKFVHFYPTPAELTVAPSGETALSPSSESLRLQPAGSQGERVNYFGGPVQHEPSLFVIFWGSKFFEGFGGPGVLTALRSFYLGLREDRGEPGEKSWQGIISQYFDNKGPGSKTVQVPAFWEIHETPTELTNEKVEEKIEQAVQEHRVTPTYETQFIVALAPETNYSKFKTECGFHSVDAEGYSYSVVPYAGDIGCEYGAGPVPETAGTAAHEFAESATDPHTDQPGYESTVGWAVEEAGGEEIADICPLKAERPPEDFWYAQQIYDAKKGECSLTDPPYPPPSLPLAATSASSGVMTTQAAVSGSVTPNGPAATDYFQYGTTNEYGSSSSPSDAGTGIYNVPAGATLTGLKPGTTYHYRTVASTWAGTSFGEDATFTTLPLPPVVTTGLAEDVKQEYAALTGTVNPNGGATTYYWEYGTTTGYGSVTPSSETTLELPPEFKNYEVDWGTSKLLPNTTYHFRFVATNPGGTSYGADREFHTTYYPSISPGEPTGIGKTEATLNAVINPESSETTYQFEYWTPSKEVKYVPASPTAIGAGSTNVNVTQKLTGLKEGTPYTYRVRATNSDGTVYGISQTLTPRPPLVFQSAPRGSAPSRLYATSCTSTTACTGVGDVINAEGVLRSLAERWDGTKWHTQIVPNPGEAKTSRLEGVSCSSASSCIAVGSYTTSAGTTKTLAEQWNGSEWKIQTTPNVSGATATYLAGVSCTSSSACMAVGYPVGSGSASPVAEQWNGSEWKLQAPPVPSGHHGSATESALSGISCTLATACTAVGNYHQSSGKAQAFAERWNGVEWSDEIMEEAPEGGEGYPLTGVSCASATACMAVGNRKNNSGFEQTLTYMWSGGGWIYDAARNLSGAEESYLSDAYPVSSIRVVS